MKFSEYALECMKRARSVGWDLSLSSIKALLKEMDNPQDKVKSVHVTGTNGKGSTIAFLNQILIEAGYRVGRFTSPAVDSELERYTINGNWIKEDDYIRLFETVARACEVVTLKGMRHPSVFEIETAMAYLYFQMSSCDIMLIEVGMGGLLDATNVLSFPELCVFTSIGLDHMQWLGDNLSDITKIKAGIIKPGAVVLTCPQEEEVIKVLLDTAMANGCEFTFSRPDEMDYALSLEGPFQKINASIAIECAYALKTRGFDISEENIAVGLATTYWPFRFERISNSPEIILDGAHNPPAIERLKEALVKQYGKKDMTFVVSVLKDKDYRDMFDSIMPLAKNIIVVESESERALDKDTLMEMVSLSNRDAYIYKASDFKDAANAALKCEGEPIVCFGTFTFLKEIRDSFKEILN